MLSAGAGKSHPKLTLKGDGTNQPLQYAAWVHLKSIELKVVRATALSDVALSLLLPHSPHA